MTSLIPLAIYVHWPWCKAKCPYCDFNSHASQTQETPYIEALLGELTLWQRGRALAGLHTPAYSPATHRIASIFFGGGTPSLMAPGNIAKIVDKARLLGLFTDDTEVTVECNPTSFPEDRPALRYFEELKQAGVNRVSVGIQGLKPEWLHFLGREHRVEDALATLDAAQAVFSRVNADVIYGLPNQALDEWENQLKTLSQRGLAHISAYQLTIEPNTLFYRDVKRGAWEPIPQDLEADFFDLTREVLLGHGYDNYEISNFAKPGEACRHNVHIWNYKDYIGIGAGAHGRVHTVEGPTLATSVIRQPEGYLKRINDLSNSLSVANPLSPAETAQEAVFSGLRLAEGCDIEALQKHAGMAAYKEAISERETLVLLESGHLLMSNGRMKLSDTGWPRLNSVLSRLLKPIRENIPATPPPNSAYDSRITVTIE